MLSALFFIILLHSITAMNFTRIKILVIEEENDFLSTWFTKTLQSLQQDLPIDRLVISDKIITLKRHHEEFTLQQVCKELTTDVSHSLVLDFSWTGWKRGKKLAASLGIPYLKAGITIHPFLKVVDDTLCRLRNATNAVFIFENDIQLKQSLYYLIEYSTLRVLALNGLNKTLLQTLADMLPLPSFVVLIADTLHINDIFKQAMLSNIIKMDDRWNLVFTDFGFETFHGAFLSVSTTKYTLKKKICCPLAQLQEDCACPNNFQVTPAFLELLSKQLINVFQEMVKNNEYKDSFLSDCLQKNTNTSNNKLAEKFYKYILQVNRLQGIRFSRATKEIYPHLEFQVVVTPSTQSKMKDFSVSGTKIADWDTENGLQTPPGLIVTLPRRFFRIGMAHTPPYSFPLTDKKTGENVLDNKGKEIWKGFCIDFVDRLAKDMNFDYEIVISNAYGAKYPNGSWNGLVGDLNGGKTDIIIASLTMTSEREQVVDFVIPYFEESGFTIVIRKPVHKFTLFKFMTVLQLNVWLSILIFVTITGFTLWCIDKNSPYSAQNNHQMYSHTVRHFTLKESFWFALTSFTPQGGGEAPKSFSGRTLVVCYWIFVVLMNSTFTANLAAFLTVERMQMSIESLHQLAHQSRIKYTVTRNDDPHKYFTYMKQAEETLLRMWKDVSLNISSTETQYRVWDYPVKEFYAHILDEMEKTGIVETSSEGFEKVLASEEGELAFIHDSAEIQYHISTNCNLTEVGETFARQPFAVAVQIGSDIKKELSRKILELQYEGFFEELTAKYWNYSNQGVCPGVYDTEGITLESLGGVFIATLVGLTLAIMSLCGEIIYHNYKKKPYLTSERLQDNFNYGILSRKEFGAVCQNVNCKTDIIKPNETYLTVMPQSQLY